jgi:peptidyl-prolyl cis-trans isomerase B (cyclophilin B)
LTAKFHLCFPPRWAQNEEGERSVASSKDRQRKLARAKLDRQMARRAGRERHRRRVLAGVGAGLAVVLIAAGVAWLGGAFDNNEPADSAAADLCAWTPQSAQTNTDLKEVGTPPTKGFTTTGTRPMTITTNQGAPIVVTLNLNAAPCAGESFSYLAGKSFYNNTGCSEITTDGAVRCGDPAGTGLGGPTYSFYNENVPPAPDPSASPAPANKKPLYPKGTVALIGNPPGSNGSQFLIFFKDFSPAAPQYPIVGTVTGGMDTVAKISKIPTVDNGSGSKIKPTTKITIQSLTVGDVAAGDTAPSAAPSASTQS